MSKDSRSIPWAEAERLLGARVDRRASYALIENEVCALAEWTDSCTGCYETGDYGSGSENYPYDEKAKCRVGMGCTECGYSGKRRTRMWLPALSLEKEREMRLDAA